MMVLGSWGDSLDSQFSLTGSERHRKVLALIYSENIANLFSEKHLEAVLFIATPAFYSYQYPKQLTTTTHAEY